MIKNYSKRIFVMALMLSSAGALADENGGLFVEPALTYEHSNDAKITWPSPLSASTGSIRGFGLAGRLGFHVSEAVFVGADARYSRPKFTNSANNYDANAEAMNLGAVVGMQMPEMGLRLWGEYIFMGSLDPAASQNTDVKFEDAKGYRVGVGFHVQSVSLNLEYQKLTYGKSTLQQAGPITPGWNMPDLDTASYIASVSFPLEL